MTLTENPLLGNLHPREMAAQIAEWTRGGLPSSSLPGGSRSADHPMPQQDRTDLNLAALFANYTRALERAGRAELAGNTRRMEQWLARATSIESAILPQFHMTVEQLTAYHKRMQQIAENAVGKQSCANTMCARPMFPKQMLKPRKAPTSELRCPACYEYRADHEGRERPKSLCQKDLKLGKW